MFGENGPSDELSLRKPPSIISKTFKTGQHDVFSFRHMAGVGTLKTIQLRMVRSGILGSGKYLKGYNFVIKM